MLGIKLGNVGFCDTPSYYLLLDLTLRIKSVLLFI